MSQPPDRYSCCIQSHSNLSSQETVAWALRNLCGSLIDSRGGVNLPSSTCVFGLFLIRLIPVNWSSSSIDSAAQNLATQTSSFGLLEQEHLQPGACWIRICILTRAQGQLYVYWCVKSTFTTVLFKYGRAERASTCRCWIPRSFSGLLMENFWRWGPGICIF